MKKIVCEINRPHFFFVDMELVGLLNCQFNTEYHSLPRLRGSHSVGLSQSVAFQNTFAGSTR
jgi:hypothetical protein